MILIDANYSCRTLTSAVQNLSSSTNEIVIETQKDVNLVKDTAGNIHEQLHSAQIGA